MSSASEKENVIALRTVAEDGLEFSKQFYEAIVKAVPGNLISSPVSTSAVLSMLAYGANGLTRTILRDALYFHNDDYVQRKSLKILVEELNNCPGVELNLANRIFVANDVNVKSDYQQLTEQIFKSTIQKVNFSQAEEAAKTINDWCKEQTASKIKDVVSSGDITPATRSILVNAVYFKGKWNTPFAKEVTHDIPFLLENGATKNVSAMHSWNRRNFGIMTDVKAKFVELPYEGLQVSMFIILPDEVTGLRNIQQNFAQLNLNRLFTEGRSAQVNLSLPKFEIETTIDLLQPLVDLGMGNIFNDSADFSGMLDAQVNIGKAVQKAYIKVDEEGTEAAAFTCGMAMTASLSVIFDFKVDRPFYYAIVKRVGGLRGGGIVLFQGHCTNPN